MHWLSKETLCTRKENGGLGFRDLHLFNLAMLARQGWCLLTNPESLCAQVLRAKYFPDGDIMKVQERAGYVLFMAQHSAWSARFEERDNMESW